MSRISEALEIAGFPEENRIARIKRMEAIMDSISQNMSGSEQDLKILTEYYESPLWREDFEADEAGKLPKDLKRGVLSEDAIYNLLETFTEREELYEFQRRSIKTPCGA